MSRQWKRRVKEGRNDDDVHEFPWVKCGECEGDWLVDWRNETGSWLQRWGDTKRNERFVIFKEADEDGQEMVTEEEEWVLPLAFACLRLNKIISTSLNETRWIGFNLRNLVDDIVWDASAAQLGTYHSSSLWYLWGTSKYSAETERNRNISDRTARCCLRLSCQQLLLNSAPSDVTKMLWLWDAWL